MLDTVLGPCVARRTVRRTDLGFIPEGGAPYVAYGACTVYVQCRIRCLERCSVRASRDVRCDGLWSRVCALSAAPDASELVKELVAKGKNAFIAEAGAKAHVWWNQSGRSEAAKLKGAWVNDKKKRDAPASATEEPAAKRQTAAPPAPAPAGGASSPRL